MKKQSLCFLQTTKKNKLKIKIEGNLIEKVDRFKYLGITFDEKIPLKIT